MRSTSVATSPSFPGRSTRRKSQGTNEFLRDGAHPITSVADALRSPGSSPQRRGAPSPFDDDARCAVWEALDQRRGHARRPVRARGASRLAVHGGGDGSRACAARSNARSRERFDAADGASSRCARPIFPSCSPATSTFTFRFARDAARTAISRSPCDAPCPSTNMCARVERELAIRFARTPAAWPVDTLYFGGGTPSRLGGEGVARLTGRRCARASRSSRTPRVTLEANPEDVTPDAARAWRAAGINRLSIGAQSFDDRVLAWMHRTHDAAATGRAVDAARAAGIENFSLDLIFALAGIARARSWDAGRRPRARARARRTCRSTGSPSSRTRRSAAGRRAATSSRRRTSGTNHEFLHAHDALAGAGFEHYEVSNFGAAESHARHNSSYWRQVPYAGLGPSAHEFDGARPALERRRHTPTGCSASTPGSDPIEGSESSSPPTTTRRSRSILDSGPVDGLALGGAEIARARSRGSPRAGRMLDDGDRLGLTPLRLAAPRRPRRRLDTRPKSLVALDLWHPRSSADASAAFSKR